MAKTKKDTNDVAENLKAAFAEFVDTVMSGVGADAEVEDDEEEEDEEFETLDREETEALAIKDLRELAAERGIEEKKKADILAALEEGGHFGDEEDEEDEEEEDEEGEDEDEWTREDLEEKDLKELRAIAKEEGASAADVRGKDQDELIDLILGEDEEDEEGEDEEDEDADEETEELDEDALKAMSLTELKSLAKELEITVKVPKAQKDGKSKEKKFFIETILNSGEEE
jgi:hypothetical protein